MKVEDFFKIQIEMKLLEAGYYNEDVWKYVNENKPEYEKKFVDTVFKKESTPNCKMYTGKQPEGDAVRMWWFKEKLHPEFFKSEKSKVYILVLLETSSSNIASFGVYKNKEKAEEDMERRKSGEAYQKSGDTYEVWEEDVIE